jgi:glycosyltransferase involved in cell wall biosynthesis
MRILLIMDPGIPVPPELYGGHERLVYLFAEEYKKLGHEVTLLAGPASYCSGHSVSFGINDLNRTAGQRNKEVLFVWKYLCHNHDNFDLIHNFGRLIYLLPVLNKPVRKIMTYGRPVSKKGIKIFTKLPNRNLVFTACSDYCVSTGNIAGIWKTVYNAIDFSQYQLNETVGADAPLMFWGRFYKKNGLNTYNQIAMARGCKFLIAVNISHTADNYAYFKTEIEPQIDLLQIKYLGPLNDAEKNIYLGQARALLFPIEWDEPFGIVMIEAMACGTPVIAFNRGSVPEVVNAQTRMIVKDFNEMINAVERTGRTDRGACRKDAAGRFDISIIAARYLNIFKAEQ